MANPEHLAILKQGVKEWNQWRKENPEIWPNLKGANLRGLNLSAINFSWANLNAANLEGANLKEAGLERSSLMDANLKEVILDGASLSNKTNLYIAKLNKASLRGSHFEGAYLEGANLEEANLTSAFLISSIFERTNFRKAVLYAAKVANTVFANVDLSETIGLDAIEHRGPSTIGVDTLLRSGGKIPEVFLRGCGLPEQLITYFPSFIGQAIQYFSCFISYSSKDQAFAKRLYSDLQSKGVRCWFAPEDMKIGDRMRVRIDESIRVHEKLLLILSTNSVESDWVEKEVETAMEKERESKKTMLFPVRLDDSVNAFKSGWAADIRRTRHIGDFSKWKNHDEYWKVFERLLRDLKVEASAEDKT
jgi:hypothetical protein